MTTTRALGSGHSDIGVKSIYSTDVAGHWQADLNLAPTRQGARVPGVNAWQKARAAAASRHLNDRWGTDGASVLNRRLRVNPHDR